MRILVQGYLNIKTILGNYIFKCFKLIVHRNHTFYNRFIFFHINFTRNKNKEESQMLVQQKKFYIHKSNMGLFRNDSLFEFFYIGIVRFQKCNK